MNSSLKSIIFILFLTGCSGSPTPLPPPVVSGSTSTAAAVAGGSEPAARMIFNKNSFTDLSDFRTPQHTAFQCLGDMLQAYRVDGPDYRGGATLFPYSNAADSLNPTNKPVFIKNVAVDITDTFYPQTQSGVMSSDACAYRGVSGAPDPSSCAAFDRTPAVAPSPTIAPTATPSPAPIPTATPTTAQYYETDFYRVRDDWCANQGPIRNYDTETSKAYVGGVSIDLDRTQLGANEDLLMLVTYHSYKQDAGTWPGPQLANDRTILKVNLVATLSSFESLIGIKQPRAWSYYQASQAPVLIKEIATLEDPYGSLRTEQVYIPLSQNALVDRIRLDRVRGSYHLFQIDLYRLGNRSN
jgi:hypothetical protein